jgi:non-ribosomal peptide synthetase component E (peptide arylation enzyme)
VGERACAVVIPRRGHAAPSLDELTAFLLGHELSKRKLPERLHIVDELPTTASGKVQKHLLVERITAMLDAQEDRRE